MESTVYPLSSVPLYDIGGNWAIGSVALLQQFQDLMQFDNPLVFSLKTLAGIRYISFKSYECDNVIILTDELYTALGSVDTVTITPISFTINPATNIIIKCNKQYDENFLLDLIQTEIGYKYPFLNLNDSIFIDAIDDVITIESLFEDPDDDSTIAYTVNGDFPITFIFPSPSPPPISFLQPLQPLQESVEQDKGHILDATIKTVDLPDVKSLLRQRYAKK